MHVNIIVSILMIQYKQFGDWKIKRKVDFVHDVSHSGRSNPAFYVNHTARVCKL